jgi:anti-anti-sigma factor
VITLSGEADLTNIAQLDELIIAQLSRGIKRLAVDAAELSFIDSTAVRTLLVAALTLNDRGGGMIMLRPQRPVARAGNLPSESAAGHWSPARTDVMRCVLKPSQCIRPT